VEILLIKLGDIGDLENWKVKQSSCCCLFVCHFWC